MDNTISFTVNQLIGFITTVGGCIVVIEAVVLIIFKLVSKAKAPEVEQNRRIKELEDGHKEIRAEIEEIKKCRNDDNTEINGRFDRIEKAQKVTLKSLQALIDLSLGVSDAEALKKVSDDLNDYLLNK